MRDELLRRGARVGLMEALLIGDDARVEELLRPGKNALPPSPPNGGSVLNFARTTFAIDRLLELGVSTELKDRWGATPIESISRLGPRGQALVRHLISRGVQAAPEEYARLGDLQTLQAIIERDPQAAGSDAVMMGAVDFGHRPVVEWLLARGGNVNARARAQSRHTALHSAAWNGDLPMTRLLVDAGADVRARDEEHDGTPLDWAKVAIEVTNNPSCQQVVDYLSPLTPAGTSAS
jgi:ankyrin repeat protein